MQFIPKKTDFTVWEISAFFVYICTRELPGVVTLINISTGNGNTFIYSEISSYANLQYLLSTDYKHSTEAINMKLTPGTAP